MKRHAIFVDAGYVFAQGSFSLLGRSNTPRTQLKLDEVEIIAQLKSLALDQSVGVQLLRVYWYDGARSGPTVEHLALANMQDVKLRLGSINSVGEQKEVDSLLITDLIDLARNQSICDATVVAADTDVRIAVQIAQTFGVRVHLVGLEPSRVSQSPLLRQEADTVHEIAKADVSKFLRFSAPTLPTALARVTLGTGIATPAVPKASTAKDSAERTATQIGMEEAVQRTLASPNSADLPRLKAALTASSGVPAEYDGRLLATCRNLLGRDLTGDERREVRSMFRRQALGSGAPEK
jgi:uncharacterized LabA/DUF88 family protein